MKKVFLIFILLISAPLVRAQQVTSARQDSVKLFLQKLVQNEYVPGIVLGIHADGKTQFYSYGVADMRKATALTENTVFEIGSITKTFTTLLAQLLVKEGKISWDDPVNKYLPDSLKTLEKGGQKVTLRHLASHTAGLSRAPNRLLPKDSNKHDAANYTASDQYSSLRDAYADYTASDLYSYLQQVTLQTVPGQEINYSNTGMALLGQVLENATGTSYQALVQNRILTPLQLKSAVFEGANASYKRAQGYLGGDPVKYWHAKAMAPAAALDMSAKDLMQYTLAHLGAVKTTLHPNMQQTLRPQKLVKREKGQKEGVAFGWQIKVIEGDTLYWHDGATGGFKSFTVFLPAENKAVVLLTNTAYDLDEVAFYAVGVKSELPPVRESVKIPEDVMKQYVGLYRLAPDFTITVTYENGQLKAQATNQTAVKIFPASESRFFMKAVDAELEFKKENGKVSSLVLHQGGRDMSGQKIK